MGIWSIPCRLNILYTVWTFTRTTKVKRTFTPRLLYNKTTLNSKNLSNEKIVNFRTQCEPQMNRWRKKTRSPRRIDWIDVYCVFLSKWHLTFLASIHHFQVTGFHFSSLAKNKQCLPNENEWTIIAAKYSYFSSRHAALCSVLSAVGNLLAK